MDQNQKTMTTCLSNFKEYIRNWDEKIVTHDDILMQDMFIKTMKGGYATLNKLLLASDEKINKKFSHDPEKLIINLDENRKKEWYMEIRQLRDNMLKMQFEIERLYELKNRKNREIILLKAALSKHMG